MKIQGTTKITLGDRRTVNFIPPSIISDEKWKQMKTKVSRLSNGSQSNFWEAFDAYKIPREEKKIEIM